MGDDPTYPKGIAFCDGDSPVDDTDYQWVQALTRQPRSIEDRSNPFTGEIRASGFSFDLAFSDIPATRLFFTRSKPDYFLSGFSEAWGTVTLQTDVNTLAGSVIWVDDEAVLLDSYSGLDESNHAIYVCTRGYYSTEEQPHEAGRYVYLGNPYIKKRRVSLIRYDRDTGDVAVKWTGVITKQPATNNEGTAFSISADSLLSILLRKKINQDAQRLKVVAQYMRVRDQGEILGLVRPAYYQSHRLTNDAPRATFLQVGDTMMRTAYNSDGFVAVNGKPWSSWGAPAFQPDERNMVSEEGYELFVVDGSSRSASSTYDLGEARFAHPIAVAVSLCITGSGAVGWDSGSRRWSCGAQPGWFDLTRISDLIDATPELRIQRLQLGWDGEPIEWFLFAQDVLLRPNGYAWGTDQEGKIIVYALDSVAIDELASTTPVEIIENRLENQGPIATFAKAIGVVGGLPWQKPIRVVYASRDGRGQDSFLRGELEDDDLEIDLRTLRSDQVSGAVTSRLVTAVTRGYDGVPVFGVKVLDSDLTGATYAHGDLIELKGSALKSAWFIANDGTRVTLEDAGVQAVGRVLGRRYDTATGTYDLDLVLLAYRSGVAVKWRAPSMVMTGNSGADLLVEENRFHASVADNSFFEVGDAVEFWTPWGTLAHPEHRIVQAKPDGTTVTLDGAPPVTKAGHIVRLARYVKYKADRGTLIAGVSEVVYCYLASSALTVGGTPADPGAVYG